MPQNPEDHLPPYRVRPRFETETVCTMEELAQKIIDALAQENAPCKGKIRHGYVSFTIPESEQHYWSPQLDISFEESEKGCLVRGLYGPRPAVWTMFVFFYSLIAFALMVIIVIGYSRYSLGHSANILYLVPILVMTFLTLYFVAFAGQRMGHDQMLLLHNFITQILDRK